MTKETILKIIKSGIIKHGVLAKAIYPEYKRPDSHFHEKLKGVRGKYITTTDIKKINTYFKSIIK